jgi:hypothetical protein
MLDSVQELGYGGAYDAIKDFVNSNNKKVKIFFITTKIFQND